MQTDPRHEEGEPPHKEHATAPRLCSPSFPGQPAVKKMNRRARSMELPRGYAPLHFRGNQQSRRRTATQGACNHPTVVRPFIFAETSGRKCELPRRKRTTAPQLCAPSASLQPAGQHGGLGPHVMQPARRLPGAEKSHRRSRQCHVFSGPSRRTEKISFQNQCSDSRHLVHGPTVTLSTKVTGQSTMGIGVAVGSNCVNRRAGAAGQPPIRLWPHLQARILP
jgi:hypothetical protein